jgi:hypothetical protein
MSLPRSLARRELRARAGGLLAKAGEVDADALAESAWATFGEMIREAAAG